MKTHFFYLGLIISVILFSEYYAIAASATGSVCYATANFTGLQKAQRQYQKASQAINTISASVAPKLSITAVCKSDDGSFCEESENVVFKPIVLISTIQSSSSVDVSQVSAHATSSTILRSGQNLT